MSPIGRWVLSVLLWFWGGTVYYLLEVAYKSLTGHQERISWTMLVVALLLTIPVERAGAELPWSCPIWLQALSCSALVTIVEFVTGVVLNMWLCLDIWDYSKLPMNLFGQICPQYSVLWFFLCFLFIPIFDFIRWSIEGGEKPKYKLFAFL